MSTQPGTGLAVFDPKAGAPAHVAAFFDDAGSNIVARTSVPSLSPQGKVWTISIDGNKTKLQVRNADGDLEPLGTFKVVVLDFNKQRGRAYYEGDYNPEKESQPVCWSDDGVAPDASLPGPFAAGTQIEPGSSRKISATCANCPMAVKGSKVDNTGKARTACGQHRMLAVIPDPALNFPDPKPLRLKIAITSDWDKESPDQAQQGWYAWSNYMDYLNGMGVKHSAALVTKMKFDPDAAFPKIFFAAERYLDANELAIIAPLTKSEDVKKLLGGTYTPAGADGIPKDQQQIAQAATDTQGTAVAQHTPAPAAAPAPAAVTPQYRMADGETFTLEQYLGSGWTHEQLIAAGKLVQTAAPPAAPAPAPAPAPEAPAIVLGEQTAAAPAAAQVQQTTTAPSQASTAAPSGAIVLETSAAAQPAAPAPVQEPAQAAAPAPAPAPVSPEPAAAAAAAAAVTPAVSADVPADVAGLLAEWGG